MNATTATPAPSPSTEHGLLPRGSILDKYRIESLVGLGGFAAVYRATHLLLRIPVAIKILRPQVQSRDPTIGCHLLEEARCAARVRHPNVVRIHDVTRTDDVTYIVMEYIEGRSLARTIHALGPVSAGRVVSIAIDVAEGLRAALEEGLIHRDIKPANILVPTSGPARIVDFGLAYVESRDGGDGGLDDDAYAMIGTRGYMAPEQEVQPHRVDFRADVYALGVTMCHALSGVAPYAPGPGMDLWKRAPPLLVRIVRQMIAAAPEHRPSSYDALLGSLREAQWAIARG